MYELRAAQPAHAAAGVLEAQGERAAQVALGRLELLRGDAAPAHAVELVVHERQHLVGA